MPDIIAFKAATPVKGFGVRVVIHPARHGGKGGFALNAKKQGIDNQLADFPPAVCGQNLNPFERPL